MTARKLLRAKGRRSERRKACRQCSRPQVGEEFPGGAPGGGAPALGVNSGDQSSDLVLLSFIVLTEVDMATQSSQSCLSHSQEFLLSFLAFSSPFQ